MMPLRCSDQSLRWIDIMLHPLTLIYTDPVLQDLHNLCYKICHDSCELLRVFLMRDVTAIEKYNQTRPGDQLVQPLAVGEWNLTIVFTPKQQCWLTNKMRVTRDAFCVPPAHCANDRALRA